VKLLLVGQGLILLALCAWIVRWPPRSAVGVLVQGAGSLLAVLALARIGLWLFPPWWTPWLAFTVIIVAIAINTRKVATLWPRSLIGWCGVLMFTAIGVGVAGLLVRVRLESRLSTEPAAIRLASPLPAGRYLVVNGGGDRLINAHRASMDTTIVQLRDWRGNGSAVDIVAINALGLRASGVLPADPSRYAIHGVDVLAPCDGTVLIAVDGLPDQSPPNYDREHPAGNHVMIDCGVAHVVLAHLLQGSVRVAVGDRVSTGDTVGAVGNSGGTDEPHLHIHAQRPGPPSAPMAGDPLPILLWDRYLVRGDRVRVR
jgi:hypothetical protein